MSVSFIPHCSLLIGGMDAAVSNALAGVLLCKTPTA